MTNYSNGMKEKVKKCPKCGEEKSVNEFYENKRKKDGFRSWCKKCCLIDNREHYQADPRKVIERTKEWAKANPEKVKKIQKKWREKDPQGMVESTMKWRRDNPERFNEYQKKYKKEKLRSDPVFKLNLYMGSAIRRSLRGMETGKPWESLVDYTFDDLVRYLESLFQEGMSWKNHGEWHIDHIIPISLWNITSTKSKGFKACWALENLRPMWARDNFRKSNKLFY